jgi:hypothetical protein
MPREFTVEELREFTVEELQSLMIIAEINCYLAIFLCAIKVALRKERENNKCPEQERSAGITDNE